MTIRIWLARQYISGDVGSGTMRLCFRLATFVVLVAASFPLLRAVPTTLSSTGLTWFVLSSSACLGKGLRSHVPVGQFGTAGPLCTLDPQASAVIP